MLDEARSALAGLMAQGGFVMPPLVGMSVLLWYALGVRMVSLRRGDRRPVKALVAAAQAGDPVRGGIVAEAAARGARLLGDGARPSRAAVDVALFDLREDLSRGAALVRTLVVLAPLAGLLGTVTGMIETFESLASMALFTQGGGVAGGIATALLTTQMGLAVAIPGLVVGRLLDRRALHLGDELEELEDLLCAGEFGAGRAA